MTVVAYGSTYALAWAAALVTNLLLHVRAALAFVAPADVAEFLSRPYVFSGICLVIVALITNGTKILIWCKDSSLRRELDRLHREKALASPPVGGVQKESA